MGRLWVTGGAEEGFYMGQGLGVVVSIVWYKWGMARKVAWHEQRLP